MTKQSKQLLVRARELFARTHWGQGYFEEHAPDKMRYCTVGGLRYMAGFDPTTLTTDEDYRFALREIVQVLADEGDRTAQIALSEHGDDVLNAEFSWRLEESTARLEDAVIAWNDNDDRVLSEVLDTLDRASLLAV